MAQQFDHTPVVHSMRARFCGRCGSPIMFDPSTLAPWHVPTAVGELNVVAPRVGGWLARRQDAEGLPVFSTTQGNAAYRGHTK